MARNSTLIDILNDFRAECRLSMNAAQNNQDRQRQVILLQRTQEELWEDFDWPHLRVDRYINLAAGQRYYDMPSDLDIGRIQEVSVRHDSIYFPLGWGIEEQHYAVFDSDLDARSWPVQRCKITEGEMLEVWPIPNTNYDSSTLNGRLKVTGIKTLSTFVSDSDKADLDDRLLALFAAAEYLASAGAKDAQLKLDKAQKRYAKLRGNLMPRKRYTLFGVGQRQQPTRKVPIAVYNKTS